jgi:hypothetical protein
VHPVWVRTGTEYHNGCSCGQQSEDLRRSSPNPLFSRRLPGRAAGPIFSMQRGDQISHNYRAALQCKYYQNERLPAKWEKVFQAMARYCVDDDRQTL